MKKKIVKSDDTEIKKFKSHQNKRLILISNIDINKIVVSNMLPFCKQGFRYFIDYKDDYCTFMDILSKSECIQNK